MRWGIRLTTALLDAKLLEGESRFGEGLWLVRNVRIRRFKLEDIERRAQHLSVLEDHLDHIGLWILFCTQFGACVEEKQIHLRTSPIPSPKNKI